MAKRKIQELTTGVHDFPTLIGDKENKYVDKTSLLYKLARRKTNAQYFISRPRRFGKSLMLSTLQSMFEGRKNLFKGLAIYDKPWEGWAVKKRHPVYSFSMLRANGATVDKFLAALEKLVRDLCEEAGVPYDPIAAGGAGTGAHEGLRRPVAGRQAARLPRRRQLRPGEARHRRPARGEGVTSPRATCGTGILANP